MTVASHEPQFIPLNKLVVSDLNVRRSNRKVDIEALAASIASHGLLQNLNVTPMGDGKFEVVAGARRLAALKQLARSGAIAKDYIVSCNVIDADASVEASLAENIHRVAMDALDEVNAFAALQSEGKTADDIARRYGLTTRHVEQRLALAALSPRLKAAWKKGDLNLEAARAFCLADDHARQEAVFRSFAKPVTNAASVRARLMEGRMRHSDRLVRFVGLEAYEAAGGRVLRDLFDSETVFVEDPALVTQLAAEKLDGARSDWVAHGWGWVEADLGGGRPEGLSPVRLYPSWREPTPEEQGELDRLQSEIDALDAALEASSVDDDPRWTEKDDLEAAYETIRQGARTWNPALMALAGVVLSIAHDGEIAASEGHVRKVDQKMVEAVQKGLKATDSDAVESEVDVGEQEVEVERTSLPKSLARDLTRARTQAIRFELAQRPDIALALCVAAMSVRTVARSQLSGVDVAAFPSHVPDLEAFEAMRATLPDFGPEHDALAACLGLDREALMSRLAMLVAGALDFTHEDANQNDIRRQGVADALADALDLDMTRFWKADLEFWTRLPKAALCEALGQSPMVSSLAEGQAQAFLLASSKLKKDALAARVDSAWQGGGYLPDLLVAPVRAGVLSITPGGFDAIAVTGVAAE